MWGLGRNECDNAEILIFGVMLICKLFNNSVMKIAHMKTLKVSIITCVAFMKYSGISVYVCFGLRMTICQKFCFGLGTKIRFTYTHLRSSDFVASLGIQS